MSCCSDKSCCKKLVRGVGSFRKAQKLDDIGMFDGKIGKIFLPTDVAAEWYGVSRRTMQRWCYFDMVESVIHKNKLYVVVSTEDVFRGFSMLPYDILTPKVKKVKKVKPDYVVEPSCFTFTF